MNSYEFLYFGRDLEALKQTIATWCSGRSCVVDSTPVLGGARVRISGPDQTIREAMRTVRLWIRPSA